MSQPTPRLLLLSLALLLALACARTVPVDPSTRLPADAKAAVAFPPLPALKQALFELCYNVPGLDGVADLLHFRFGLDLEADSEGARFGVADAVPLAVFLRGPFWVLAVPLADPERFGAYLDERLVGNGFDRAGPGAWTQGKKAVVARVEGGLAWIARGQADGLDYLRGELDKAAAGPFGPPLAVPADATVALRGRWFDLMSALDPLAAFGDVPLAVRGTVYGFGDVEATARVGRDGVKLDVRLKGGGNAGMVRTLAGGGAPRWAEATREAAWSPVVRLAAHVSPALIEPWLPADLKGQWDGSVAVAVGIPKSPAKLVKALLNDPSRFPWSELPWVVVAGRTPHEGLEALLGPVLPVPYRYGWAADTLTVRSGADGRGETPREPGPVPPGRLGVRASFRALYEALRETDLFPYALKLLSGPRELTLDLGGEGDDLALTLELTL